MVLFYSFAKKTTKNLSTLVPSKVEYCAFVICEDGKNIEGFIKLIKRCRLSEMIYLLGYGFFELCINPTALIARLKSNTSFLEFGNKKIKKQGTRKDLEKFKQAVKVVTKKQMHDEWGTQFM